MGLRLSIINGMQTLIPVAAGAIGGYTGVGVVFAGMGFLLLGGAFYMRAQSRAAGGP
jgi:hypothetical protein